MSSASPGQRFADYFAICGLDTVTGLEADQLSGDSLHISPMERSYKAKVFAHFPNCVDWNPFDDGATRMLCLPQGLTFKKQSEPHEPSFHSFLITREDGSRVYGAALTFYEEVRDVQIVTAMQTLQQMHDAELALKSQRYRKRSASVPSIPDALIPPDPPPLRTRRRGSIAPGASDSTTFDIKKDKLLVAKCICMIIPLPFVSAAKSFLEQLYEAAVNKKESYLPLECYIYNLIFEVPLPPPGRTMRFTCTGDNITCQRPGLNELPLFDYSLKELCGLLGVENIVQLFTCILLEYQILIVSNSYHRFMLAAESFSNVIFPFVWQHVYVPILPASLAHFLDAPVPFIMGLYCKTEEEKSNLILPSEASLCLVDIDNSSLTTPEELPELPNKLSLVNELYDATEKFSVPVPKSCHSRFNSNRNSLEIPYSDYSANGNTDYDSTGSNHSSPRDSDNSPTLERKRAMSPKCLRRSCPPVLLAREKPAARVKTQRTNRVPKSKSSTSLDLSNNPRLRAIAAIAERTGIVAPISTVVAGLEKSVSDTELTQYCEDDDVPIMGDPAKEISRQQQHENEFNTAVREIFANWFTQVLREYESFVIQPQQDMDQWISNREEMQNFDKAAFLSDQPNQFLPFLSPFTETQMFASFIDMKIMSTWEEPEPRLAVFDQRVESMKSRLGVVRSPSYEKCNTLKNAIQVLLRRSNSVDHMAIYPHQLVIPIKKQEGSKELFAGLYGDILSDSPFSKGGRQPKVNWRKRGRQKQHSEHLLLNNPQDGKKIKDKMATSLKKYIEESKGRTQTSQFGDMALESTQSTFIQRLLKECQQKTKRMLVQKMGQEAVDLGHGDGSVSGVEENTLIASLCDLLERVWSHGLQTKEGKSALWSHLLAYQSAHEEEGEDGVLRLDSTNHLSVPSGNSGASGPSIPTKKALSRRHSAVPDLFPHSISFQKKPLTALLADMGSVQQMTQIKTDVGHARAWTRLALEKKVLSKHLRRLLSDDEILKQRYKDYAFLRTEEEREQFVYHLLSLTAVDFYCFTNCFTSTSIAYKVVIKTGKSLGGGSTSASAWMTLAGELDDTGVINIPKNENEFRFKHSNLGVLTTLRIGHDNSGLSPSWFIEQVIVKNEITGHIYRFPCGRWLSKSNDDGSFERLLVAERLRPRHHEADSKLSDVCRLSPQKKPPVLSRRSSIKTRIPDVQEKLADSVNNIVKFFYKPEKERGNLTYLLCGDGGLCQSLEQVFQCGFKSFSLFRNSFFIWDILEKAQQYLAAEGDDGNKLPEYLRKARKSFCTIITRINNSSHTIGKDGKFQSFVCLGARDHLLHDWLQLISTCPATTNMYDTASFFRDQALMQFLVDVLGALVEFNITLEASLLKGIS